MPYTTINRNSDFDIDITVGGRVFSTHKDLLRTYSTYFKRELLLRDYKTVELHVDNIDATGLGMCIEYMYSQKGPGDCGILQYDTLTKALRAADFLEMQSFKEICQETFCSNADPSKGLDLVEILKMYGSLKFVTRAKQFVKKNIHIAITDERRFTELQEEDFFYYITDSDSEPAVVWNAIKIWMSHGKSRQTKIHEALDIFLAMEKEITMILPSVLEHCMKQNLPKCVDRSLLELETRSDVFIEGLDPERSIHMLQLSKLEGFPAYGLTKIRDAAIQNLAKNIKIAIGYPTLDFRDFQKVLNAIELSNREKWNVILPWVQYDKSREIHLVELIKTMDLGNLTKQFIAEHMKRAECVKESKECLEFLLDLQLKDEPRRTDEQDASSTMQTKLAVLDSGKCALSFSDVKDHTYVKIPLPEKKFKEAVRVTSLSGDLYIQYEGKIRKMKKDGSWERVGKDSSRPSCWKQFVSFDNKLAVVTKDYTTLYEPSTGECQRKLGCKLGTGFSGTGSNTCLFVVGGRHSSDRAKKYSVKDGWLKLPRMPILVSDPAIAYFKETLYVMGGSYIGLKSNLVIRYDGHMWVTVSSMHKIRSKFGAVVYHDKLYVVGGSSKWGLQRHETIEEYNESSGTWNVAGKVEVTKGVVSLAVCKVDTSQLSFVPWNDGIQFWTRRNAMP